MRDFCADALVSRAVVALQATGDLICSTRMRNKYWDLRELNNVNSKLFLQWNEYKRLTCDVFHCIFVSVLRLTFFFFGFIANHCYTLQKTKSRQPGHSIWQGPGPVATRMLFSPNFESATNFFQLQPKKETSSSSLGDRLEKSYIISPSIQATLRLPTICIFAYWKLTCFLTICLSATLS